MRFSNDRVCVRVCVCVCKEGRSPKPFSMVSYGVSNLPYKLDFFKTLVSRGRNNSTISG